MAKIIAGRFETQTTAEEALASLHGAGIAIESTGTFHMNPPGQHGTYPIGGDSHHDEGTRDAPKGAGIGAAVGVAAGLATGTIAAVAAAPGLAVLAAVGSAAAGGFAGSLAGAMSRSKDGRRENATHDEPVERPVGVLVVVNPVDEKTESLAIRTLRLSGAKDIEESDGVWEARDWVDFDPLTPPRYLDLDTDPRARIPGVGH